MDAHALLTSQGWRGTGHSLHPTSDTTGLSKPLLVSQKQNNLGVGKKQHKTSDMWWMNAFDSSLKGLDTSKEGVVVQTITSGGLDMVARGGGKYVGKGGLYASFVRGECLGGTLTPEEEEAKKEKRNKDEEEESKRERRKRKAAKRAAREREDGVVNEPQIEEVKENKEKTETREERRARKAANRALEEQESSVEETELTSIKKPETKEERKERRRLKKLSQEKEKEPEESSKKQRKKKKRRKE